MAIMAPLWLLGQTRTKRMEKTSPIRVRATRKEGECLAVGQWGRQGNRWYLNQRFRQLGISTIHIHPPPSPKVSAMQATMMVQHE